MDVYGFEDLNSLAEMEIGGPGEIKKGFAFRAWVRGMKSAKLGLVKVGLKTSFDDFERAGESCCSHPTKSASGQHVETIDPDTHTLRQRNAPMALPRIHSWLLVLHLASFLAPPLQSSLIA